MQLDNKGKIKPRFFMKLPKVLSLKITFILVLGLLFIAPSAAQSYRELKAKDGVSLKYKWKDNKQGKRELRVKFNNKSKTNVNVDVEIGFYTQGVLEETVEISDCLKRSFFDNWFRPIHIVSSSLNNEQLNSSDLQLEASEFKTEQTDECRETDR